METEARGGKNSYDAGAVCSKGHGQTGAVLKTGLSFRAGWSPGQVDPGGQAAHASPGGQGL